MNRERLEQAVTVLERVPVGLYNHNHWVDDERNPYDCNTIACAAGWLARDPGIRAQGFHLEGATPYFGAFATYEALAAFFDIDQEDALEIFSLESYDLSDSPITVKMVIGRIQNLLVLSDA